MARTNLFHYQFSHCGKTDIGLNRQENQDAVILCPETGFFAVSDGMGGLADGGRTSLMIAQELPKIIAAIAEDMSKHAGPPHETAAMLLNQRVRELSDTIFVTSNRGTRGGFGATISGVWLVDDKAVFVNIGDSRGYILAKGEKSLKQVTVDHNVAQEMVGWGQLAKEEARLHPASSMLTRYAGMAAPAEADVFTESIQSGDRILICSDGLHSMAGDDEIALLLAGKGSAEELCGALIALANANGGRDNIAVICIEIESPLMDARGSCADCNLQFNLF